MTVTLEAGPFAGLKRNGYGAILADPAWAYLTYSGNKVPQRAADQHYSVMTIDELKTLPVGDLARRDCILVMWVIGSHIDQAVELGRAWGFTFKSDGFVWVKTGKHDPKVRPISLGKWVRKQTEYTLLFTKGSPKRLDAGVRQLIEADEHIIFTPKREHSRKPDEQYGRIERLVAGPYVELFARQQRDGWDAWGDQQEKFNDILSTPPASEIGIDSSLTGDEDEELFEVPPPVGSSSVTGHDLSDLLF